jgi:Sulfotransferase domain
MSSAKHPSSNRLVATIGLHGSASTWVFNIVRELLIAAKGEPEISCVYTEELGDLPLRLSQTNQYLLIKSHHGTQELDAWLNSVQPNIFLSVRDPRDASISMAQRFNAPLEAAVGWLVQDCRRMMKLGDRYPVLRYEDRFFESPTTVEQLSKALNLTLSSKLIEPLFHRYSTAAMRSLAQNLTDKSMDITTQIHRNHIGDTRSGKWRELPGHLGTELTHQFRPFLDQFGYM